MRKLLIVGTDIFNAKWFKDRWEYQKVSQKYLNKIYTNIVKESGWFKGAYHEAAEIPEKAMIMIEKKLKPWEKNMPERKSLPSERRGRTFKAKINNNAIYVKTGEYPDGTLGEIFIEMYKEGAGYKSILGCFSICISWLLQYGVPLEKLVEKFQYTRFEPAGMVTGDNEIKMCSSILDYVFRRVAISYLGRTDLGNVAPAPLLSESELPEFVEDMKVPEHIQDTKIEARTSAGGIIEYSFTGYKSEEFLEYCRKNNPVYNSLTDEHITLDFSDDSIVVFGDINLRDKTIQAMGILFTDYFGKPLAIGDL